MADVADLRRLCLGRLRLSRLAARRLDVAGRREWSLHAMGDTDYTFPVSLAVGADGAIVAVGRQGTLPIAWTASRGPCTASRSSARMASRSG